MRHIEKCPVCEGQPKLVIEANHEARARFIQFSQARYAGLMNAWLDDMSLVVDRCIECGHYWYRNQPEMSELLAMYEAARPLLLKTPPSRMPSENMILEMTRLRKMVGNGNPVKLLDYGSGFGRWARAANKAGFSVTAYEPSVVRGGESEETEFTWVQDASALPLSFFDAVNLEQVLEHVPDPLATMTQIRKLCKPGAVVRVTVPNILRTPEKSSLWSVWPFDGRVPHTLAPFEHLHGFTVGSMMQVSKRAGFCLAPLHGKVMMIDPAYSCRKLVGKLHKSLSQTKLYLIAP